MGWIDFDQNGHFDNDERGETHVSVSENSVTFG